MAPLLRDVAVAAAHVEDGLSVSVTNKTANSTAAMVLTIGENFITKW
jgi:hypothetical protein